MIQHVHFGLGVPECDTRFQPRQHPDGVLLIRLPDIGPIPHPRPRIRARRYTDDGLRGAVHEDPLAQNCRIAMEPAVPVMPAHHHHAGIAARRDILRSRQPPDGGFESEHLEIISQDVLDNQGLRIRSFDAHTSQIVERHAGESREDMVMIADVLIFVPSPVAVVPRPARILIQKLDELFRMRDRQLVQHEGIE